MGALKAALQAVPKSAKSTCIVGNTIKTHEDGADVARVVNDMAWSASAIATALAANGVQVSASAIRLHRRGQCSCAGVGQ